MDEAMLYHASDKDRRRDAEQERRNKEQDMRMKHGKNWKQFTSDADKASDRLRPGEVKRFDKTLNKWVSNKD
jgi:hypothetical protein